MNRALRTAATGMFGQQLEHDAGADDIYSVCHCIVGGDQPKRKILKSFLAHAAILPVIPANKKPAS